MRVFGLLFFLFSFPLWAKYQITTQIHDIDYGKKSGDDILVFLASGHVAKLKPGDQSRLLNLTEKSNTKWFKFYLDKNRFITKIENAKALLPSTNENLFTAADNKTEYVPTTIASMEVAQQYFKSARYHAKDSQCFNRAMIWSYEWWKEHSLKSGKILIYFTRNYIRRYNFEWWFHIAPYVHVMHEGKVVERAMDRKYSRGPMEFRKWTNLFMRNDAVCPVITKYSDYADSPYIGECYLMRTNMYTYQPADLQMNEAWGYVKDKFNMTEVKAAYKEAFDEEIK